MNPAPSSSRNHSQVPDQRLFKFAFAVFILEVEELQKIRVAHFVLDRYGILGQRLLALRKHGRLAF